MATDGALHYASRQLRADLLPAGPASKANKHKQRPDASSKTLSPSNQNLQQFELEVVLEISNGSSGSRANLRTAKRVSYMASPSIPKCD